MSFLKIIEAPKIFKETGSAFDATDFDKIKTKPGGHECVPSRDIDISAFSYSKKTPKGDTSVFLKRKTGNGGTMVRYLCTRIN